MHGHGFKFGGKISKFGGKSFFKVELYRVHGVCFFSSLIGSKLVHTAPNGTKFVKKMSNGSKWVQIC